MRKQGYILYGYWSARRSNFSPVTLVRALVPVVLVLLVYAIAWFAVPKFTSVHAAQTTPPTFSRSWYIESSVGTAFSQLKQNMLQQAPLYYVTSMPVPL